MSKIKCRKIGGLVFEDFSKGCLNELKFWQVSRNTTPIADLSCPTSLDSKNLPGSSNQEQAFCIFLKKILFADINVPKFVPPMKKKSRCKIDQVSILYYNLNAWPWTPILTDNIGIWNVLCTSSTINTINHKHLAYVLARKMGFGLKYRHSSFNTVLL